MNILSSVSGFTGFAPTTLNSTAKPADTQPDSSAVPVQDKPLNSSSPPMVPVQASSDAQQTSADDDSAESAPESVGQLSEEELVIIDELAARDQEVRIHEQQHAAVGGQYAGAPSYEFERGPDGRLYAVAGEVSIDTSAVPGDPVATLEKAEIIQRAAMAPAEPSGADRRVAAAAAAMAAEARAEISAMNAEKARGEGDDDAVSESAGTQDAAAAGTAQADAAEQEGLQASREPQQDSANQPLDAVNQRLIQSGVRSSMFPPGSLLSIQA